MAAAALAGCGGHTHVRRVQAPIPKLPRVLGARLAALSDDVARELDANDACAASSSARALQRGTIAAINRGAVPPALQETLQSAVTDLASRIRCVPSEVPARTRAPRPRAGKTRGHDTHRGRGHGKGKHERKGKGDGD